MLNKSSASSQGSASPLKSDDHYTDYSVVTNDPKGRGSVLYNNQVNCDVMTLFI